MSVFIQKDTNRPWTNNLEQKVSTWCVWKSMQGCLVLWYVVCLFACMYWYANIQLCLCIGMRASGVCVFCLHVYKGGVDRREGRQLRIPHAVCLFYTTSTNTHSELRYRSKVRGYIASAASWLSIQSHCCDTMSMTPHSIGPRQAFKIKSVMFAVKTAVKGREREKRGREGDTWRHKEHEQWK